MPPQRLAGRAAAARPPRDRANGGAAPIDCLWVTRIAGRTIGTLRLVGVSPHV